MLPSIKYKTEMFPWKNSNQQRELMINDKCENFQLIPPL